MDQTEKDFYLLMRRKKSINQAQLAEHLKVTQAYVCMFEKNKREMAPHNLEKYKKYILEK